MTTSCCDVRRLVKWSIVFVKRGLEAAFPEREELIDCELSESDFATWKIAEFTQGLPRMPESELPPSWRVKNYPPVVDGRRVLPPGDGQYLRVYSTVLDCFEVDGFDFQEEQVKILREIRDALAGERPPHPHRVKLPKTGRLSTALDSRVSEFGDEFLNFPPFMGQSPEPGHTYLSGWLGVDFAEPQGDRVEFSLSWYALGTPVTITFGAGQQFVFANTRTFPLPFLPDFSPVFSRGTLDLATGKVVAFEINATFQGTTIARTDRVNRIAYAFPYIYPPLPPPPGFVPPPGYQPPTPPPPPPFGNFDFSYDWDGNITGFELHSVTVAPVGLFPFIAGLFPPFTFGPNGEFHFASADMCLPGTPPGDCPTQATDPDGILTSVSVYFHPHIDLVSQGVHEVPAVPPPPPARSPVAAEGAAVVGVSDLVYRIGGRGDGGVLARVDVFDPAQNAWTAGPALPKAVAGAAAAVSGDRIYLFGGWTDAASKTPTDAVQVFDTGTRSWSQPTKLPQAVAGATAAAAGGKIYVIAGATGPAITGAVRIYDPASHAWSDGIAAAVPTAGASAVAVGNRIYVAGGRLASGQATNRTAILETATNLWALGPDLLYPTVDASAVVLEERILLLGGRPGAGLPSLPFLQELPLDATAWRPALPAGVPVAGGGTAVAGGALWAVGGRVQSLVDAPPGALSTLVQVYRPFRGWDCSGDVPVFTSANVMNAAGLGALPSVVAPGSMAMVWGFYFAGPGEAPSLEIRVGGKVAPLIAVVPPFFSYIPVWRAFFQIPADLDASKGKATFEVIKLGAKKQAAPVEISVAPTAPGLFLFNYGEFFEPAYLEHNGALAVNEDGTLNSANQPVVPGQTVTLWATGLGADPDLAKKIDLRIGGKKAKVQSVSPPPSPPPGLPPFLGAQLVAATVPDGAELASFSPVAIKVDGKTGNPVGLAVRDAAYRSTPPTPFPFGLPAVFPWIPVPAPPKP